MGPPYQPTLGTAVDSRVLSLIGPARVGRLLVYAGAGISLDSGLPTGPRLSREVHTRLGHLGLSLPEANPDDLLAVADAAAVRPGGLDTLRDTALQTFPFTTAVPSNSHRALALLLLEGALQLLTTNWDTCIEDAAAPERISTVVTDADRLQIQTHSLLKVHGCADRPSSLLITTQQLDQPPLWTGTAIAAGLSEATVVFLGIGDVAPYVQQQLRKITAQLGPVGNVAVVSPSIESSWDASKWATLLPSLPTDRRWGLTAADFCQALLFGWVNSALSQVHTNAGSLGIPRLPAAFGRLHAVLQSHDGERILGWLRRCHLAPRPGKGVAHDGRTSDVLLALALQTDTAALDSVPAHGPARTTTGLVDLLIAPSHTSGLAAATAAHLRAERYRRDGLMGPTDTLSVICAGQTGPLQATSAAGLPPDLIDAPDTGNIITGATVELLNARKMLEEAA